MKRYLKWFIFAVILVAAICAITYRAVNKVPSENLSEAERVLAIFEQGGCADCHSTQPNLPFYANWPVAGKMVMVDIEKGYHAFDIEPALNAIRNGEPIHPVDLGKLEMAVFNGTMPLAKYYLVHWGSSITNDKMAIAVPWLNAQWANSLGNGADSVYANEPVRPIGTFTTDAEKVALGKDLFHDGRLSADNSISCSSCHGLDTGGVDNEQFSDGVGGQLGGVNAPTVYNAVYNFVQFWDGRAATLEEQAAGPPLNPVEMACESFDEIVAKLAADKEMVKSFKAIYPDKGITQ